MNLAILIGNMRTILRAAFPLEIGLSSKNGTAILRQDRKLLDIIPISRITS